jgi:tetratricopeptide (TPR) repeat protein/class 3 adenylate cyclase
MPRTPLTQNSELPQGRITIVCTDLTNSTGILAELGQVSYRKNLFDPYLRRLESLLEPGTIFQFKGDGYIVVFESAKAAIVAAVELQRDFERDPLTYTDPDSDKIYAAETRVSIYTSPADVSPIWQGHDGWQYVVDATNLAARLEGIGHGGQILAAQSTLEKIGFTCPYPTTKWEARKLKGSRVPVDVYEIHWEERGSDALPETRGEPGLPYMSRDFFGNGCTYIDRAEKEDAVVQALLEDDRKIVTIHASGGMGKTSLARRCAAKPEIVAFFTEGITLVLLENSIPTVESVKDAICTGLNWKSADYSPDSLRDTLRSQRRLLVLDNYESVKSDDVRGYLKSFIGSDAAVRFLVTSRDPVGLAQGQEQRISLDDGMSDTQADALLIDRLRAQKGDPTWQPSESEITALLKIREATENNNPLALDLIIAWVTSTYTLPEIAASVSQNLLSPFTGPSEDKAPLDGKTRHLSVAGSLEWSWQMLLLDSVHGPFLTEGLTRLSLFPESFSRENVEGASGYSSAEANRLLTRLSGASLLREGEIDDTKRYRLHRATREFARQELTQNPDVSTIRRRFVDYWREWLIANNTISDLSQLTLLRLEWPTLLAAFDIAEQDGLWASVFHLSSLQDFLRFEGRYATAEDLLLRAIDACDHLNRHDLKRIPLVNLGSAYRRQNMLAEAEDAYHQALTICREFDDKPRAALTLTGLGNVYGDQGRFADAEDAFRQSLVLFREENDRFRVGQALIGLGNSCRDQNRLAEAEATFRESLEILREFGDRGMEGTALHNLGGVYRLQNRLSEAEEAYLTSIAICREFGDRVGEGLSLAGIGDVYRDQQRISDAELAYRSAREIRRALGDRLGEASTLLSLADFYVALSRLTEAEQAFSEAREVGRASSYTDIVGKALLGLGNVFLNQNRISDAEDAYNSSLAIFRERGDTGGEERVIGNLGRLYELQNRFPEAEQAYRESLAICQASGDTFQEELTLRNLGNLYLSQNRFAEADTVFRQIVDVCQRAGYKDREANAWLGIGNARYLQNHLSEAEDAYRHQLALCRDLGDRYNEGLAQMGLGNTYKEQNRFEEAEQAYHQSLAISRALTDTLSEGQTMENLALLEKVQGNIAEARNWALQAIALLEQTNAAADLENARALLAGLEAPAEEMSVEEE